MRAGFADTNGTGRIATDQYNFGWLIGFGSAGCSLNPCGGSINHIEEFPETSWTCQLPNGTIPQGIAVDSTGDAWIRAMVTSSGGGAAGEVIKIQPVSGGACNTAFTIYDSAVVSPFNSMSPYTAGIAIDGGDNVWIANAGSRVVKIAPDAPVDCSSGCQQYESSLLSAPVAVAIDSQGNLWLADGGNNSIVELPRIAAPTVAPIASQTK